MTYENAYYEVKMHYSQETADGFVYTENEDDADEICAYVQVRDTDTNDLIDGTDEEEFPNTEEGYIEAVKYAESLVEKYGTDGYEFY